MTRNYRSHCWSHNRPYTEHGDFYIISFSYKCVVVADTHICIFFTQVRAVINWRIPVITRCVLPVITWLLFICNDRLSLSYLLVPDVISWYILVVEVIMLRLCGRLSVIFDVSNFFWRGSLFLRSLLRLWSSIRVECIFLLFFLSIQ